MCIAVHVARFGHMSLLSVFRALMLLDTIQVAQRRCAALFFVIIKCRVTKCCWQRHGKADTVS